MDKPNNENIKIVIKDTTDNKNKEINTILDLCTISCEEIYRR